MLGSVLSALQQSGLVPSRHVREARHCDVTPLVPPPTSHVLKTPTSPSGLLPGYQYL